MYRCQGVCIVHCILCKVQYNCCKPYLNDQDVLPSEGSVVKKILEILCLQVQLLDRLVGEHVSGGLDHGDVRGVVVDLVHDWTVVFSRRVLEELQLQETCREGGEVQKNPLVFTFSLEWLAGAGIGLVLLDEGHDVDQVEDVTVIVTATGSNKEEETMAMYSHVGVLEGLQAEGAVVEREPFVVNLGMVMVIMAAMVVARTMTGMMRTMTGRATSSGSTFLSPL